MGEGGRGGKDTTGGFSVTEMQTGRNFKRRAEGFLEEDLWNGSCRWRVTEEADAMLMQEWKTDEKNKEIFNGGLLMSWMNQRRV